MNYNGEKHKEAEKRFFVREALQMICRLAAAVILLFFLCYLPEQAAYAAGPAASDSGFEMPEDIPYSETLPGEGSSLTYEKHTDPEYGTADADSDGSFLYTPAPDYNGTDSFSFVVNDVEEASAGPVANASSFITPEDTPYYGTLSGEGASLTYKKQTDPTHGTVDISSGGSFLYTPAPDYNGADSFTFVVNDGTEDSLPATVSISVTAVNDAPSFSSGGNQSILEDGPAQSVSGWAGGISGGPADESGQVLTFIISTSNDAAFAALPAISPATGDLTYHLKEDYHGSIQVSVFLQDNGDFGDPHRNTSPEYNFTITVLPVNDVPYFTKGDSVTVDEDSGLYSSLWATDISAGNSGETDQKLTFYVSTNNNSLFSQLPVMGEDGILTFSPASDANGTATVSVFLTDDGGTENGGEDTSETVTFVISITPVNDAPYLTGLADQSMAEDDSARTLYFQVHDIDNDESLLTLTALSSHPELFPASSLIIGGSGINRTISFVPAADRYGTATITVTVSDGEKQFTKTFGIFVSPVNDLPVISRIADQSINEDTLTGDIVFTVSDIETLDLSELDISYSADNPVLFPEGSIEITGSGGKYYIRGTPAGNLSGTEHITVTVKDAEGGESHTTFTVTVNPVNDPPELSLPGTQNIDEDTSTGILDFTIDDADTDIGLLGVSASSSNTNIVADADIHIGSTGKNRTIWLTPMPHANGTVIITVTVNDGSGGVTSVPMVVNIAPVNDPPEVVPISDKLIMEDETSEEFSFTVNDIDNNEPILIVTASSRNEGIISTLDGIILARNSSGQRIIQFKPEKDAHGTVDITVTVSDGSLSTDYTFKVTVENVNDAPEIGFIANQILGLNSVSQALPFWISDIDDDTATLELTYEYDPDMIAGVEFGGSGKDRTIRVTTKGVAGSTVIRVTVKDSGGLTSVREFTVETVAGGGGEAIISAIPDQVTDEDIPSGYIYFDVKDTYNAVTVTSGNPLLVSNDSDHIKLEMLGKDGDRQRYRVYFIPLPDMNGNATMTVTAEIPEGSTVTKSFLLTVRPVNDYPEIIGEPFIETDEDNPIPSNSIRVSDMDGDDDIVSIEVISHDKILLPSANVSYELNATGGYDIRLSPDKDRNGKAVITVIAVDKGGLRTERIFHITVNSVNDIPEISEIENQIIDEDTPSGSIPFTVRDVELTADNLRVSAISSRPDLISDIIFGGRGENRTIMFTPKPNVYTQPGEKVTITVDVSDGGATVSKSFDVTINPVNDNPHIGSIANQVIDEDTSAGPFPFTIGDIDTAVGDLTVEVSSTNPSLIPAGNIQREGSGANRTITLTPVADAYGSANITITVKDGQGGISTRTFHFEVISVNDLPTITAGDVIIDEDHTATDVRIMIDDKETPKGSLIYEITSSNQTILPDANIEYSYDGNGELTLDLKPDPNQNGVVYISVKVSDSEDTTTKSFRLDVRPVNDPPTISSNPSDILPLVDQTINEDQSTGVIPFYVYDVEKASGSLIVTATSDNPSLIAQNGIILGGTGANRTIQLVPLKDQFGTAVITVRVSDGDLYSKKTFTVTVNPVNDEPSFVKGSNQTVLEDSGAQTVNGWVTAFLKGPANEEDQTLEFEVSTDKPELFVSQPAISPDGVLSYTPASNAYDTAIVTVRLKDSGGTANGGVDTSAEATFTIDILPVNDAPTFTMIGSPDQTRNEDDPAQSISGFITGTSRGPANELGQTLTFLVTTDNDGLFAVKPAIDPATGVLTYTLKANEHGTAAVYVSLKDNGGTANGGVDTSAQQTFTITVHPLNDEPTLSTVTRSVNEDRILAFTANDFTSHFHEVDKPGDAYPALVQIKIFSLPANGKLRLDSADVTVNQEILLGDLGKLTFTPNADWSGSTSFTWNAWDGEYYALSDALVNITVNSVNDVPSFTMKESPNQELSEDAGPQVINNFTTGMSKGPGNESGQTLIFVITTDNDGLFAVKPAIDPATGVLTYTLKANEHGTATVYVSLKDNGGTANGGVDTSAQQTFTITVHPLNDEPTLSTVTRSVNEDRILAFTANDFTSHFHEVDKPGDDHTSLVYIKIISLPANGTMRLDSADVTVNQEILLGDLGKLTFTPNADWSGSTSFTWNAWDGEYYALSDALVNITVNSVNDIPSFTMKENPNQELSEDAGPQVINNFTTGMSKGPGNESGQMLIFVITTTNDGLFALKPAIDPATGVLTYTLKANEHGTATVYVSLKDNGGTANGGVDTSAAQTFTITVNPENDAPTLSTVERSVNEDGKLTFTANDFTLHFHEVDKAGDDHTSLVYIKIISLPSNGTMRLDSADVTVNQEILLGDLGKLTFTPDADWNGSTSFKWNAYDGELYADEDASVNITVNPVNDAPVNDVMPSYTGTMKVGQELTANPGTWNDNTDISVSGSSSISYAYQWETADDDTGTGAEDIAGANSDTFTITTGQAHKYIRLRVTASDSGVGSGNPTTIAYSGWILVGNTAPLVSGLTKTAAEDSVLTFTPGDFTGKYTDADLDSMTKIKITSLPGNGVLKLDGTPVSIGDEIDVSDIGKLTFTPNGNWNGDTSFTWNGFDGMVYADADAPVTINITPVNDAPVNEVIPSYTGTMKVGQELTADPGIWNDNTDISVSGSSIISYTYQWEMADDDTGAGAEDIAGANSDTFTITTGQAHKYIRLRVTASDSGVGSGNPTTIAYSGWILVGNTAPTVSGLTKTAAEDSVLTFTPGDFTGRYTDADLDSMTKIKITSLPGNGVLKLDGTPVSIGDEIDVSDIGKLTFTPNGNWNGDTSFTWNGFDGTVYADADASVAISITPVNDAPVNDTVPSYTGEMKVGEDLTVDPGIWNDNTDISVSGSSIISYTYQWETADDDTGAGAEDIAGANSDKFTITTGQSHKYIRLRVTASDSGVGSGNPTTIAYSGWILVGNTAPTVSGLTKTAAEDSVLTFTPGDFTGKYMDADLDSMTKIKITSLPGNGVLKLDGTPVSIGDEIDVSDIGKLTFTPNGNWNGDTSFKWNGFDGTVYADADASVAISITPVNDAPVLSTVERSVNEDGVLTFTALDFTSKFAEVDSEDSFVQIKILTLPSNGTLRLDGFAVTVNQEILLGDLGKLTFTPNANWNGNTGFTWNGFDGVLYADTGASVDITVNAVNDAPVNDTVPSYTGEMKVGEDLTADPGIWNDNTDISVSGSSIISYTYQWEMADDDTGAGAEDIAGANSDTFTITTGQAHKYIRLKVTASDSGVGSGNPTTTEYSGWILVRNTAPVVSGFTKTAAEDSVLTFTPGDFTGKYTDADLDSMTKIKITSLPGNGVLKLDGTPVSIGDEIAVSDIGKLTFTPNGNWNGDTSFTWNGFDGAVYADADASVAISITPVNDAPVNEVIPSYTGTMKVGQELTADPGTWNDNTDTSVSGSSIISYTYQWEMADDDTGAGAEDIAGANSDTFTITTGQAHKYIRLRVTASDSGVGSGNPTTTEYSGWILVRNTAPVVSNLTKTAAEDSVLTFTPGDFTGRYTDADLDSMTKIKITSLPGNGVLKLDGTPVSIGDEIAVSDIGKLTFTPNGNWNGDTSFTWNGFDGAVYADANASVAISVTPVNDAPVADSSSLTVQEDTPTSGQLSGSDIDPGTTLTYELVTGPFHGKVTVNSDGSYTYTPDKDYNGSDSFTFRVNDGALYSEAETVTIAVTPVNDAPVADSGSLTVQENTPADGQLTGNDMDAGTTLTYELVTGPSHGKVTVNSDGSYTYVPDTNYSGSDSFTFKVNDGELDSEVQTITITVTPVIIIPGGGIPVNNAPTAHNGSLTVQEDTPTNGQLTGSDMDTGTTLTYELVTGTSHGNVTVNSDGNYTYTPDPDYNGSDSFTFKVNDGALDSEVKTIIITVIPVNDPPVVQPQDTINISVGEKASGKVTATDKDKDPLTYTADTPAHGTVVIDKATGAWIYTPDENFSGADSFKVTVSDGKGGVTVTEITIKVLRNDVVIRLDANPSTIVGDGKQTTLLTVTITDQKNKPLSDVIVTYEAAMGTFIGGNSGKTNASGISTKLFQSMKITGVNTVVVPVTVTAEDKSRNIYASAQIMITFEPGAIAGIVIDNDTGKPVESALVEVSKDFDGDGTVDFYAKMVTGADGHYRIAIPEGNVDYIVQITKPILIGDSKKMVTFNQTGKTQDISGTGKEEYKSVETAAGMIFLKQTDGTFDLFKDYSGFSVELYHDGTLVSSSNMHIFNSGANKGSFSADGLKAGENYEAKVKYTLPNGETIIVGTVKISISEEGEMNISSALIDPYGTITDMDSHEVLQGVEVKLYYADTKRNREAGRLPGTLVDLPLIEGFEPADNGNPQTSDRYGKYAYMVFPYADYYIIANKEGYLTYTSPIISVEDTIVKLDIAMQAVGKDDIRELEIPKTGDGSGHLGIAFLGLAILSAGLNVYLKLKFRRNRNK